MWLTFKEQLVSKVIGKKGFMNQKMSTGILTGCMLFANTNAQAGFLDKMSDIAQVATVINDVNNASRKTGYTTKQPDKLPTKQQETAVTINANECRD